MKICYKQGEVEKFKDILAEAVDRLSANPDIGGQIEYELEPATLKEGFIWYFGVSKKNTLTGFSNTENLTHLFANKNNGKFTVENHHRIITSDFSEAIEKLESSLRGEYFCKSQLEKINKMIEGKVKSLKDKTNYINIRGPSNEELPIIVDTLSWDYAFEVPDKDGSTSGLHITLYNKKGEFEINGQTHTTSINRVIKGIEQILLDERGRKKQDGQK